MCTSCRIFRTVANGRIVVETLEHSGQYMYHLNSVKSHFVYGVH
jgi:hypothetical protein